jgi:predicted amidohydrolase YtcJ
VQQGGHGQHRLLRRGHEAEGGEAAAVLGLTPGAVVGRPVRADAAGRLRPGAPARLTLAAGRIAEVRPLGPREEVRAADALGDPDALLLPALADPHLHVVACAAELAGVDLSRERPRSLAELLARLAAAARALPDGAWLRVAGHDEAWLAERRQPTRAELDEAVPRHPLRVRHATRHATLLNTAARRRVERVLGPLRWDGALVHGLEPEITRVVGPLEPAPLAAGIARVGRLLADRGVVALDEVTGSNDAARVALLAAAVADGALSQRVRVYVCDADEVAAAHAAAAGRVAVAGVKLFARSCEEARAPALRDAVARARRRGLPVAVHAVEADVTDAVLDVLADAPARASQPASAAAPDRIEHASLCPPELARRIAGAGVAVVTQPVFLGSRGVKYKSEVEEVLWPWLYPLRTLRAAGVLVAAGSDAPVGPLDPWLGFAAAVERTAEDGTVLGAAERIAESAALDLVTAAPARLHGEGPAACWPAVGSRADLLVADARSVADGGWGALRVRATLAGGRVIGGEDA